MSAHSLSSRPRRRPSRLMFEGLEPRVCLSSVSGVTVGNYLFKPLVQSPPFAGSRPAVGPDLQNLVANGSGVVAYTMSDSTGALSIQRTDGVTPRTMFDGAGPLRVLDDRGLGIDAQGDVYFVGDFTDDAKVEHTALLSTKPGDGPEGLTLIVDAIGQISAGHPVQKIDGFSVSDSGSVVFSGPTALSSNDPNIEGVFTAVPSGDGYLVSPVTSFDTANLKVIGPGSGYHVNSRNSLIFLQPLSSQQGGLVMAHDSELDTLVTQAFGQAPRPGSATLRGIYSYDLSDQDTTAIIGTKLDAKKPQNPSLFVAMGSNLVTLIDGDSQSSTYPVTNANSVAINSNNVVAFVGEGQDSTQAIYLTMDGKNFQRVIGHGDRVGDAQVVMVSLVSAHSIDDQGNITFRASLSTGQVAVYRAMLTPIVPDSTSPGDPTSAPNSGGNSGPGVGSAATTNLPGVQPLAANSSGSTGSSAQSADSSPSTHGPNTSTGGTDTSSPSAPDFSDKRRKPAVKSNKVRASRNGQKNLVRHTVHKLTRREWNAQK